MGRLRRWFRGAIRRWLAGLLDDDESNELIVVHPMTGRRETATAQHIAGQMLVCISPSSPDKFCVSSHRAADAQRFWRIWRRLGGDKLRWPDGEPFDPNATKTSKSP